MAATLARTTKISKVVGIDPSAGFIEYANAHNTDPRIRFDIGDAQQLPYESASFDRSLALLIINFVPDASKMANEMRRVTRPGGVVATAMWDNTGANELMRTFWDAVVAIDPTAPRNDQRPGNYGSPEALSSLWDATGLVDIQTKQLSITCDFASFDDYWLPRLEEGPTAAYFRKATQEQQNRIKEKLREKIFGNQKDGPFTLDAKAWAVRGFVP